MGVKLKVVKYTFAKVNVNRRRRDKIPTVWYIEGLPPYGIDGEDGYTRCGPYDTYQEARSDCDGMQRVFDNEGYK